MFQAAIHEAHKYTLCKVFSRVCKIAKRVCEVRHSCLSGLMEQLGAHWADFD